MNEEQVTIWNGVAGNAWVDNQALLDGVFEPIEDMLLEKVRAGSACHVLDLGCGTGATTLVAARRLGPGGRAVGIDVSTLMTDAARARATREGSIATFVCADAQNYAFEAASFDLILSRFGVMFFDDTVQAFTNLRRAARADAELDLFAWRSAEANPFMTTAERAAAPFLPNIPARRSDAPGQFAFGDSQRVRRMLEQSGWSRIEIRPVDVACRFPEAELVRYITQLGPVGRALHEVSEAERTSIIQSVRHAFGPFVHGPDVRFTAACWRIGATAKA
jgi:ubiquinone/menaquinone biosynthesis C-methylase UbiE